MYRCKQLSLWLLKAVMQSAASVSVCWETMSHLSTMFIQTSQLQDILTIPAKMAGSADLPTEICTNVLPGHVCINGCCANTNKVCIAAANVRLNGTETSQHKNILLNLVASNSGFVLLSACDVMQSLVPAPEGLQKEAFQKSANVDFMSGASRCHVQWCVTSALTHIASYSGMPHNPCIDDIRLLGLLPDDEEMALARWTALSQPSIDLGQMKIDCSALPSRIT